MHPSQLPLEAFTRQCEFRTQRRSGPGGQHRNKVETGVFVTHTPTGIQAIATEARSQAVNREMAVARLRVRLAIEHRISLQGCKAIRGSDLWQSRCQGRRIAVNPGHDDFAALLAEAMDVLAEQNWDFGTASEVLTISKSQLLKLLSLERDALAVVNQMRVDQGLPPLVGRK